MSELPFDAIDPIVHEPARLHILTLLTVVESADFLYIIRQTGLTKGNLSSHLSKLEAAGYVEIKKEFLEKMPHTLIRISARGKKALQSYRSAMTGLLKNLPE
jgi:DNA-binding MarR family transcriptional regulator